jgi:hypothetical protein
MARGGQQHSAAVAACAGAACACFFFCEPATLLPACIQLGYMLGPAGCFPVHVGSAGYSARGTLARLGVQTN